MGRKMGLDRLVNYNPWRVNRLDHIVNNYSFNSMLIIKNKWFPFRGYKAINIFGIIFTKSDLDNESINHERIHTEQMKEMLFIFFYLWYGIEYVVKWICNIRLSQHEIYRSISFEQEAYNNQNNLEYLKSRKRYAWFKYISN